MRIGIVGDIHLPFEHPRYREFCADVFDAWDVDKVHFAGDIVDQHALGFWDHDPDGFSASGELTEAVKKMRLWHATFDDASVSIGNHDARHFRAAAKAGIPARYMKDYCDVFETPSWKWGFEFVYDDVLYEHGTGSSGKFAAYNRAVEKRMSVVMGHVHSGGGVLYHCNERSRIFGLNAGCGIDCAKYAFAYGKPFARRPTLGCGVVIDGVYAYFEPMLIGKREPYRSGRRRRRC